jgi:hypothetical protein
VVVVGSLCRFCGLLEDGGAEDDGSVNCMTSGDGLARPWSSRVMNCRMGDNVITRGRKHEMSLRPCFGLQLIVHQLVYIGELEHRETSAMGTTY